MVRNAVAISGPLGSTMAPLSPRPIPAPAKVLRTVSASARSSAPPSHARPGAPIARALFAVETISQTVLFMQALGPHVRTTM